MGEHVFEDMEELIDWFPLRRCQVLGQGYHKRLCARGIPSAINCFEVRREHASTVEFSRPLTYPKVGLYSSRKCDERACRGGKGRGHVLR